MDQFVHCSTKAPWLILLISIFTPGSICMNAYQAEGGICWKTLALGMVCEMLYFCGLAFSWALGLGLLLALPCWIFGVYHGYLVMQKSK